MEANPLLDKYGKALEEGEIIFKEDEDGDHMFIIQEGKVQISRIVEGKEKVMAVLEKGDFFGEMAIVNRIKRTATARAAARTTLLAFDRVGFVQMVEKNPKIALNIIDKLCKRLYQANSQIRHMAKANTQEQILLHIYYQFMEKAADGGKGPLSRHEILEELGMNLQVPRAEFEEQITLLIEKKIVEADGEQLYLRHPKNLQKLIKEIED